MKLYLALIIFASAILPGCSHKTDESAAIKKVLETESASWRSGDSKAHAACWKIQPYSKILVSTSTGAMYDVPPAQMIDVSRKMGDGGSSSNSDYKMSIHDNIAWVSHHEESIDRAGTKTYSQEIKMLEKADDEWKIVGESIHLYKK